MLKPMKNIYLLKDVAQLSGYSVHTLKYYLQLGLFREMGRSPTTNFRFFDDLALEKVKKIRELRLKNVSLIEIKQILK